MDKILAPDWRHRRQRRAIHVLLARWSYQPVASSVMAPGQPASFELRRGWGFLWERVSCAGCKAFLAFRAAEHRVQSIA
jgi:hypothetical protein